MAGHPRCSSRGRSSGGSALWAEPSPLPEAGRSIRRKRTEPGCPTLRAETGTGRGSYATSLACPRTCPGPVAWAGVSCRLYERWSRWWPLPSWPLLMVSAEGRSRNSFDLRFPCFVSSRHVFIAFAAFAEQAQSVEHHQEACPMCPRRRPSTSWRCQRRPAPGRPP